MYLLSESYILMTKLISLVIDYQALLPGTGKGPQLRNRARGDRPGASTAMLYSFSEAMNTDGFKGLMTRSAIRSASTFNLEP